MKCVRTSRTGSFRNLSPLEIVVSRNVVSVSDTSAENFIVGWWLLACSMNCDTSTLFMVQSENMSSRESCRPVHPILHRWISRQLFCLERFHVSEELFASVAEL